MGVAFFEQPEKNEERTTAQITFEACHTKYAEFTVKTHQLTRSSGGNSLG